MPAIGKIVANQTASEVTSRFFGTVVKTGEGINNGVTTSGRSTNYGLELVGNTTTTQAMDLLQLGSIRYPGGTESRLFDITDATDVNGLKRAIDYCQANGLSLNFTLNDAIYIDPTTQIAAITALQRAQLVNFLMNDLIGYANSKDVTIESIHIGNEFQGRLDTYGKPAWKGYANVTGLLVNEIDAVLDTISMPSSVDRPQIVIQPPNYMNTSQQQSFINILNTTFGADGASAASKLNAIDVHGAGSSTEAADISNGFPTDTLEMTWADYFGSGIVPGYEARLVTMMSYWTQNASVNHVEFRNDAWAYATSPTLNDAALGLLQLHTASKLGFISVTNYIGYNNDASALIGANGGGIALRPGGSLFAMMSDALQGTTAVTLTNSVPLNLEDGATEIIRIFAGGGRVVLYDISRTTQDLAIDLNVSALIASLEAFVGGVKTTNVDILGSTNATHISGTVTHEYLTLTTASLGAGNVDYTLNAYEIAQVSITANGVFADSSANSLNGNSGADILHGLDGNDTLNGLAGADTLAGGAGFDRLFGGEGNDILFGGSEGDILDGGTEIDTASYQFAASGVSINLTSSSLNTGDAAGDIYISIENLIGSSFDDKLIGNSGNNALYGGDGNDIFYYSGGSDQYFGGAGSADTLVLDNFNTTLSLFDGTNNRGIIFSDIENVEGGHLNDSIAGNSKNNRISGLSGNDYISGFGGDDFISGNSGNDVLWGNAGNDTLASGPGVDNMGGGAGNDQFIYYTPDEGGDIISDFGSSSTDNDMFMFRSSSFANIGAGMLNASQFVLQTSSGAAAALDSLDRFIFRTTDKTLWFDSDGKGGAAAVLIADLQNTAANLTVDDIWLY